MREKLKVETGGLDKKLEARQALLKEFMEILKQDENFYDLERVKLKEADEEGVELLKEYLRLKKIIARGNKDKIPYSDVKKLVDDSEDYFKKDRDSVFAAALHTRIFQDIDEVFTSSEREKEQKLAA